MRTGIHSVAGCSALTTTHSRTASTSAASFSFQFVVSARSLIRKPSLLQQAADQVDGRGLVPLHRPDLLLHDLPVAVDQEALGDARRAVVAADGAGRVAPYVEREPEVPRERGHVAALVPIGVEVPGRRVDADGDDLEPLATEPAVEPLP